MRSLQVTEGTLSSKAWYRAAQMNAVHAIKVKGNFMFDAANHRDFLGACMGCGIERSKVGDILVQGEQGAQILLVPELVPHLEMQLTQVRNRGHAASQHSDMHQHCCSLSQQLHPIAVFIR